MAIQEKGWINEEIFCEWLDHFKESVLSGVSPEKKHLFLIDRHSNHITNNVCTKGALYDIDIGLLPSHTSHKIQSLDISIFRSFKSHFDNMKKRFINANPSWSNGNFDKSHLKKLASSALKEALSVSNIQIGFTKPEFIHLKSMLWTMKLDHLHFLLI